MNKPVKKVTSQVLLKTIKPLLENNQSVRIKVSGTSMRPFLKDQRTHVMIAPITNPLKKHQILLYETKEGTLILHRLIKVNEPLILCGDALLNNELIPQKAILGVVTSIEHPNKHINMNSRIYHFKVTLWIFLKPIRKYLLKLVK